MQEYNTVDRMRLNMWTNATDDLGLARFTTYNMPLLLRPQLLAGAFGIEGQIIHGQW